MSRDYFYNICKQYEGREAEIRDRQGKVYVGTIERVDNENVYLRLPPEQQTGQGGPGLFFIPLAIGALIALPLIGLASVQPRGYY